MSTPYLEWKIISEKINSIVNTCNFLFRTFQTNSQDPYNATGRVGVSARKAFNLILNFKNKHELALPPAALETLNDFLKDNQRFTNEGHTTIELKNKEIVALVVALSLLESDVTYHLNDLQAHILKTVEVAFSHLQRQLVADKNLSTLYGRLQNMKPGWKS